MFSVYDEDTPVGRYKRILLCTFSPLYLILRNDTLCQQFFLQHTLMSYRLYLLTSDPSKDCLNSLVMVVGGDISLQGWRGREG